MQQMFEMLMNYWITERIMKNKRIPKVIKCGIWLIMGIPLVILLIYGTFFEAENTRQQWIFGIFTIVMLYVFIQLTIETWKKY